MLYIQLCYEKNFRHESTKQAYLLACDFVARHLLSKGSKVEVDRLTWNIVRVDDQKKDLPTFRLSIYYKFDDEQFMQQTCETCKQFHKSFFINEEFNCNRCNKVGYEKNVQSKLLIGAECFRKKIDDEINRL